MVKQAVAAPVQGQEQGVASRALNRLRIPDAGPQARRLHSVQFSYCTSTSGY
jgi:hypothetical protein